MCPPGCQGTSQRKQTQRKQTHTSVRRTYSFRPRLTNLKWIAGCLMSNRFCYIWPSTTDHSTPVIDRIPLKSSTMASSGWPRRQLWLFWRPRPLNSACADGLKLGSTNLSCDQIWPEINSYFDLICVGETKIGGSNQTKLERYWPGGSVHMAC